MHHNILLKHRPAILTVPFINFAALKLTMFELQEKVIHEERQGEAYAPFESDPNQYSKKFYIESYGCAMNFNDSEIVASILNKEGFGATKFLEEANLILLNTCSI